MPTFEDPKADADELGQAARGLAYATRNVENPANTYEVLGSVHQALSGVQQSLRQLASWHDRHARHAATDDGDRAAGAEHAVKAGGWLTIAAAEVEQVLQLVMAAQSENGRIAWHPEAAPTRPTSLADALAEREAVLNPERPASDRHTNHGRGHTR
jgi:hypothetical protein